MGDTDRYQNNVEAMYQVRQTLACMHGVSISIGVHHLHVFDKSTPGSVLTALGHLSVHISTQSMWKQYCDGTDWPPNRENIV